MFVNSIKKNVYVLDDGKDLYEYRNEESLLKSIDLIKKILIKNKKTNMIFCLERTKLERIGNERLKVYILVNEPYNSKEEVIKAIKKYKTKGFVAYPIL